MGLVVCKHCKNTIGTQDPATDGWRIRKWTIGITSTASASSTCPITFFSTQRWISARLLYLVENTGLRKFHVHTVPTSTSQPIYPIPSLLLWVFTPDLLFSSSIPSPGRLDPTRSMKVFFERKTWQPLQPGDAENASIEDVEFSQDLYEELDRALRQNQRLLPPTAKKFQGWEVSLLERFEVAEAGMGRGDVDMMAEDVD